MERNEFGLAGAFALILCAILLIALALAGTKHSDMASWAQAIGTVGAIVAAILMPIWDRRRRLEHDQAIAAMRVAAHLRVWLGPCAESVQEVKNYISSSGAMGTHHLNIPPLGFDMNEVAGMILVRAKVVYSIIEQRARAVSEIEGFDPNRTAQEEREQFYRESAKLFRRVRKMYRILARDLGLHPSTCLRWELDAINTAAQEGGVKGWKDL